MLLSVFTPTHNPRWLSETFDSLATQPGDWEWILCPREDVVDEIPEAIRDHSRVKLIPQDKPYDKIGAAKAFACNHAEGEVLVELDHDDLLAPGILDRIRKAADDGGDFIYSDVAVFNEAYGKRWRFGYAALHGWEHYPARLWGSDWCTSRAFPPTPRSLCEVFYAPDHVRCWRRKTYQEVGGHNINLEAGDDHELICRTYLAGARFHHIPECGYLYRYHNANSFQSKARNLIETVMRSRASYLSQLIIEWCRREGLLMLSGDDTLQYATAKPNRVGCLSSRHLVDQHIGPEELVPFLNDTYDLLAPGGWVFLEADPALHTKDSFTRVTKRGMAKQDPRIRCRYQALAIRTMTDQPKSAPDRIQVVLCALKGQRQPGKVEI
jgi:glycosyltransferase involved in cell wall biosynthesis